MERRQIKRNTSFEERLADQAKRLRERANRASHGAEHDDLIRRARQMETTLKINAWLTSPGLASPK
jgi:hypothetical protein